MSPTIIVGGLTARIVTLVSGLLVKAHPPISVTLLGIVTLVSL